MRGCEWYRLWVICCRVNQRPRYVFNTLPLVSKSKLRMFHLAPPQFDIKLRNQTSRRGDPAVLQCEAKGEKPIGIVWNINNKRLEPKGDARYTIREETLPNGVLSDLSIKRTERSDSALFTCVATNSFGSDDTSINMIVQEVPEIPYGLKVLDKSGRSVQLSWVAPYDGNSPIKK